MRRKMIGSYCDYCRKPTGYDVRVRKAARFCSSRCEYEHKQLLGGRVTRYAKDHH